MLGGEPLLFAYLDRSEELLSDGEARSEFQLALTDQLKGLEFNLELAAQAPWFLGDPFTALDIYAAVFSE